MGVKRHTGGRVGWGQDHQVVNTNVEAAYLVIPFKHQQPVVVLEFNMPIMSLKDGNANVAHLSLILKSMVSVQRLVCRKYSDLFPLLLRI
jgi:hypothetical protein